MAIRKRRDTLVHSGEDFRKTMPVDGWSGDAADAAQGTHEKLVGQLDELATSASYVIKGMDEASDAIPPIQRQIANAESLAQKYGYKIADDGAVTDTFPPGQVPKDLHPEDRANAEREITDEVHQALRTATDIGHDLTVVFQRAQRGDVPTGTGTTSVAAASAAGTAAMALTVTKPPACAGPQQVADWWTTLSTAEQDAIVANTPNWIGNLNGVPATARSKANMNRLPAIEGRLGNEIAQLKKQLADAPSGGDYQTRSINAENPPQDTGRAQGRRSQAERHEVPG
ncbi:MAG: hypothetical protein ACRDRN_13630 [Sciscionella sp.]